MRAFLLTTLLVTLTMTSTVLAQPGRYQAAVISEAGRSGPTANLSSRVLILDTLEGHIWTWSENEAVYGDDNRPQVGTVLIYQGRVRPGKKMGDIIDRKFHGRRK